MDNRCAWVSEDKIYIDYHDQEWGLPVHDDNKLFECLILEGAQAGLSWLTVLKKCAHYHKVFDGFDVQRVSKYDERKIETLLQDAGIIRNRLKVSSAVRNAKVFIEIQCEFGSFDKYIWCFVNGAPIHNHFNTASEIPSKTELSDMISKDLKKRGMNFVGSTIIYAFMQAIGMVNDHTADCFLYTEKL
ncbi:MAG: DNA-3-methyladenine glycosylase I [Alphaproteobacteria bacterium]|jgi:DNA-3-methyladenine glycosylase I